MKIQENSIVYPLPTPELIKKTEDYWRVKLPNSYKEFISKYNGGIPIPNSFFDVEYEYYADRFLCLLMDYKESIFG